MEDEIAHTRQSCVRNVAVLENESPLQLLLPVGGDMWSGESNSYMMKMILLGSDLEYSKHRMVNNLIFFLKPR